MENPGNALLPSALPSLQDLLNVDADISRSLQALADLFVQSTGAKCVCVTDFLNDLQSFVWPSDVTPEKKQMASGFIRRIAGLSSAKLEGDAFLSLMTSEERAVMQLRHPVLLPAIYEEKAYGCIFASFSEDPADADMDGLMLDMAKLLATLIRNSTLYRSGNHQKDVLLRILENINACIYVNHPETYELLFINKRMRDEFGLGEDYLGQRCFQVFQSDFQGPCEFCPYEQLRQKPTGETITWEEANTVTGLYYRNTDSLIPWVDGSLVHLQHSVNISEEKRKNEILFEAKQQAEQANMAKSDFLSRMSHEIRTPINAVMGLTRIAKASDSIEAMRQNLDRIDVASNQLLSIINDILDMSKISANKMTLSPERFDLEKMLMDISNTISVRATEKMQKLHIRMHMDMPRFYNGDSFRLSQVITNLLSNAVKFTPERGKIVVDVSEKSRNGNISTVEVSVSDSGIGISPQGQKHLFTSFEQADGGIARKFGGTGLGLAICKSIVEMMGGQISVKSAEGKGSTFTFTVRMEALPDEAGSVAIIHKDVDSRKIKTLLIDDEQETREYFEKCMRDLHIDVETAKDGHEGLRLIQEAQKDGEPFSVVFVDWHMPGIDGIDTLRLIKEHFKSCIVVLVSIGELSDVEEEARAAGASRFIAKPLFPSKLIDAINELLGVTRSVEGTPHSKRHSFSGAHILLAEDIEINKDILAQDLLNTKIKMDWAQNGKIAVQMFRDNPDKYDLILMDVHMPEMDGLEATREIRALRLPSATTIPIIAMTANVFTEDVQECLDSGMNDHLSKPVDVDKLFDTLTYYLSRYEESAPAEPSPPPPLTTEPDEAMPDADIARYLNMDEAMNRLKGNRAIYKTLLKSFLKNNYWQQLTQEMDLHDYPAAEKTAHAIKGMAGNLALTQVYNTSALLNAQLKGGMDAADSFAQLNTAMENTLQAIEAFLRNE